MTERLRKIGKKYEKVLKLFKERCNTKVNQINCNVKDTEKLGEYLLNDVGQE